MSTVKEEGNTNQDVKTDSPVEVERDHDSTDVSRSEPHSALVTCSDEQELVRKLDRRILPIICSMYFFACALFLVNLTKYHCGHFLSRSFG